MDKIYVLITGEYSDWCIMGFATTEEEARSICARKNADMSRYDDEWYYEEVDRFDYNSDPAKIVYRFTVTFHDKGTRTWTMDEDTQMSYYASDDKRLESISKEIEIRGDLWHSATCEVLLDENDPDRAKKIAQDRLYKKLAEVELEYEDTLPPKFLYFAYFKWDGEKQSWSLSGKSHMEKTNRLDKRIEEKSLGRFELGSEDGKRTILVKTVLDVDDEDEAKRISKERFSAFLEKHKGSDVLWLNGTLEEG